MRASKHSESSAAGSARGPTGPAEDVWERSWGQGLCGEDLPGSLPSSPGAATPAGRGMEGRGIQGRGIQGQGMEGLRDARMRDTGARGAGMRDAGGLVSLGRDP